MIERSSNNEAGQILQAIVEYDEDNLEALIDLSVSKIFENKIEEALKLMAKVLRIDSNNETVKENIKFLIEKYGEDNISQSFELPLPSPFL